MCFCLVYLKLFETIDINMLRVHRSTRKSFNTKSNKYRIVKVPGIMNYY